MINPVQLGTFTLSEESRPFIIAELSGNHHQSLDTALQLVDAAANAGVHAVKLQTYTADTMTLDIRDREFFIHDPNSLWFGKSLYELYQLAYTPWEWHSLLFNRCKERGLMYLSSPFDISAIDFLEQFDMCCYKIASFEMVDLALIARAAKTGKPLIISTGMASLDEIADAVECARDNGCKDLILLKCTSSYPACPSDSNIATLPYLRQVFQTHVGLSDHTMGIGVALASVALGARVIEKHFILKRDQGGVDAAFSLNPDEMKSLVDEATRAHRAIGNIYFGALESELTSRSHRRSLYFTMDLQPGDVVSKKNVRAIRPGNGLLPKYLPMILGLQVVRTVLRGDPVTWEAFKVLTSEVMCE